MDPVFLARIQFAFTVGFHYIFPPLTIGLGWMIFWYVSKNCRTGNTVYRQLARFWTRIFAITFACGVATGITMEFQFGTNWAAYSRFVGDVFGAPLAAEGVFAFFLESSFLAILLYGEQRVSKRVYRLSSFLVAFGATLSAFWIVVANSWQQTPAGHRIVNGRAELIDIWAAIFNPSSLYRYSHVIAGALVVGTFFILSGSAIMLLRSRHEEFAKLSLKTALIPAFLSVVLVMSVGHSHALQVTRNQPLKMAVYEGLWDTQAGAPLLLFGIPDAQAERTNAAIQIPGLLSYLIGFSRNTVVKGIKEFPAEDRPPVSLTSLSFHAMVYMGGWLLLITTAGLYLRWRERLFSNRLYLFLTALSLPLPFLANQTGWIAAEVGRQPWIVYNLMRTKDAISSTVSAGQIMASLVLFALIYSLIFIVWVYLLRQQFIAGPRPLEEDVQ